jgi:hypothetical protein
MKMAHKPDAQINTMLQSQTITKERGNWPLNPRPETFWIGFDSEDWNSQSKNEVLVEACTQSVAK